MSSYPFTLRRMSANNKRELERLKKRPGVNQSVANLNAGETMQVTEPSVIIPPSAFEEFIDNHVELLARAMYEGTGQTKPRGVRLLRWSAVRAGERFRSGFEGILRDVKVSRLAVPTSLLDEQLGQLAAAKVTSASELVFSTEMKSTGREPEVAQLRLLVTTEASDKSDRIKITPLTTPLDSAELVERLRGVSAVTAAAAESAALQRPYSGGLPGLGKK